MKGGNTGGQVSLSTLNMNTSENLTLQERMIQGGMPPSTLFRKYTLLRKYYSYNYTRAYTFTS